MGQIVCITVGKQGKGAGKGAGKRVKSDIEFIRIGKGVGVRTL